jgi:hypothetical protein
MGLANGCAAALGAWTGGIVLLFTINLIGLGLGLGPLLVGTASVARPTYAA